MTTTDSRTSSARAALELAHGLVADASGRVGPSDRSPADALVAAVDDRLDAGLLRSPDLLAAACEHLSGATLRAGSIEVGPRPSGVVYTPPDLAAGLVAVALHGAPGDARVLDPACGGGAFLLASLRHLARAAGSDVATKRQVLGRITGIDVDPLAAGLARRVLWLEVGDPDLSLDDLDDVMWQADALTLGAGDLGVVDVVVGNPPFLSPLRGAGAPAGVDTGWGARLGTYADHAAAFLAWAHHHVDPDRGRVLLVQPASVLAWRDTSARMVHQQFMVQTHFRVARLWRRHEFRTGKIRLQERVGHDQTPGLVAIEEMVAG